MHPGRQKDDRLLFSESEGSRLRISLGRREAALSVGRDRLGLISDLVSGTDGQKFHWTPF